MKLSTAIRKGAKMTTPFRGVMFKTDSTTHDISACALGAALIGVKGKGILGKKSPRPGTWSELLRGIFPELTEQPPGAWYATADHQAMGWPLFREIVYLNDLVRLTREEIADRLEAIGL